MRNYTTISETTGYELREYAPIGPNKPERQYRCKTCGTHYVRESAVKKHTESKH